MKTWVTGAAGFLGSHLIEELRRHGHVVTGNDNGLCSSMPNLYCKVDCRNFAGMKKQLGHFKPDVLIHCAATAHEGLSNFSPSFITSNVYEASVATFSAAIASGVKRIIFMSSMARYGNTIGDYSNPGNEPVYEYGEATSPIDWLKVPPFYEWLKPNPIDPYGIAKVAAEDTLKALCKLHGVEYVIAVPHNIIGARQRYNDPYRNVASIMINRALQGKPILVYGDGQQKRCFSPVADCLSSLVKMIDAPISGEVINIGPDTGEITVLELAEMIRDLTGNTVEIQHMPDRPNEVKNAYCSSDKARNLLGYEPKQSLHDCLSEMVCYIKKHGTKEFEYTFPVEILTDKTPRTWVDKLI